MPAAAFGLGATFVTSAGRYNQLIDFQVAVICCLSADVTGALGAGAMGAIPALFEVLKSSRLHQCYSVAYSLDEMGPAAKDALPALTEAQKIESIQ